jgi:hypothetical protein
MRREKTFIDPPNPLADLPISPLIFEVLQKSFLSPVAVFLLSP